MPNVAVVLSGCGVYDGSEIHEAVLTLLALDEQGATVQCFAPDVDQRHVVNHMTGEEMAETRNVLVEAARIARGKIQSLAEAQVADFDAVVLPGGFGAAKNLCSFAFDGPECSVNPEVARFLSEMQAAGKPIGLACIAPAIGAKVFGAQGVELTIGNDTGTATALQTLGATHVDKAVTEVHVDTARKIVTTPAYMYGEARISEVAEGLDALVRAVLELI